MKSYLYPCLVVLVCGLAVGSARSAQPAVGVDKKNVTVNFEQPDRFTDARESFGGGTSEQYLDDIRDYLQEEAARLLTAGQELTITIKDIDLAGDFVPGRAALDDVRIVKEIYIPRMELEFRLTDAKGGVLREGKRQLRNPNFMSELRLNFRNMTLGYDKALLSDWLREEFKS